MNRAHAYMAVLGFVTTCPGFARADAIIVTKAMTASTIAEIFIDEGAAGPIGLLAGLN